jgi:hypothetical protein
MHSTTKQDANKGEVPTLSNILKRKRGIKQSLADLEQEEGLFRLADEFIKVEAPSPPAAPHQRSPKEQISKSPTPKEISPVETTKTEPSTSTPVKGSKIEAWRSSKAGKYITTASSYTLH